ncbi:MAG: TRAP transporter substrate-binding protein DctP [Propionivibrio sp.]
MQSLHLTRKLLLPILAALLLPATASAEKILRYSDHEPLGGMRTRFIKEVFFPAIEKESNGRLKIEAHWDGEIAKAYDALGAVRNGKLTDMAIAVPEYTAKELPLHQIFKSFPVGPSGEKQVSFFRRVYAAIPDFSAELEKNNVVEILLSTGYPVAFFSTQPLNTLEGIKGGKWRSASFWHQDFLRNSGAIPVTMHWGEEVYQALAARTLDGLMVNVDSGYELKVHEHAPNVLVSKELWLGHLYPLVMNRDTWNGLAKEGQEAIQRAAETAYQSLGAVMDRSFDTQVEDLKKAGATTRLLARQEVDAFKTATKYQKVQAAWVKEQEGQGVKDAGTVLEKVSTLLNETMQ